MSHMLVTRHGSRRHNGLCASTPRDSPRNICIIAALGCLRFVASIMTLFKKGKSLCERSSIRIVTVLFSKGGLPFEFTAMFCVIAAVIIDDHAHVKDGRGGACITDQVLFGFIYGCVLACMYVLFLSISLFRSLLLSFPLFWCMLFLSVALALACSFSPTLTFFRPLLPSFAHFLAFCLAVEITLAFSCTLRVFVFPPEDLPSHTLSPSRKKPEFSQKGSRLS